MNKKVVWSIAAAVMVFGLLLTIPNTVWSLEERLFIFASFVLGPPAVIFLVDWCMKEDKKNSYRHQLFKEFKKSEKS